MHAATPASPPVRPAALLRRAHALANTFVYGVFLPKLAGLTRLGGELKAEIVAALEPLEALVRAYLMAKAGAFIRNAEGLLLTGRLYPDPPLFPGRAAGGYRGPGDPAFHVPLKRAEPARAAAAPKSAPAGRDAEELWPLMARVEAVLGVLVAPERAARALAHRLQRNPFAAALRERALIIKRVERDARAWRRWRRRRLKNKAREAMAEADPWWVDTG